MAVHSKYYHLRIEEREVIAQLHAQGKSQKAIGLQLGRTQATISRELKRSGCGKHYSPWHADQSAKRRRCRGREKSCKMNRPEIRAQVVQGLQQGWSPEQIAGRMRRECPEHKRQCVSYQTIYRWIHSPEQLRRWDIYLRRFRWKKRRPRDRAQASRSVKNRPEIVQQRDRFGDWEADTIIGPRHHGPALLTMIERRSGFAELIWVQDLKSATIRAAMQARLSDYPQNLRQTLTLDNGREFGQPEETEKLLQTALYFINPHSPWQHGVIENLNGLARQYFPKGTHFRHVSRYKVAHAQELLNHRPRKRLNYQTPAEVMLQTRQHALQT